MKTEVIMKRKFIDGEVSQKSKSEFLSSTDLMRIGNKWRILNSLSYVDFNDWYNSKNTKEFVGFLEKKYGEIKISARGRGKHTWIHPFLFIKLALHINPEFEIEVYEWLYDNLLRYRNESGTSYKKMTGAIKLIVPDYKYRDAIKIIANKIKLECNVTDWQTATEEQLKLRDRIQENISLLSDIIDTVDRLVAISIKKAKENNS